MAITTNAELNTAVANWLNRSDLTSRIPEFIVLFEASFNRTMRTVDMLTNDTAFSVTGQYVNVPTGFLQAKRLTLLTTPVTPLEYMTPESLAEQRQYHSGSGRPQFYTVTSTQLEFLPSPDATYTANLSYYKRITAVASSDNWLLTNHPDIYLFGALVAAEPYLKNDERLIVWQAQLSKALDELRLEDERKSIGGTPTMRARSIG